MNNADKIRALAFHFPQFHTIPENDKWWGKGFTDWTNVRKAKPLFEGHYQPHLPLELDFYNLLDPNVLIKQAELARINNIFGFAYYHYWFNGKKILEKPVEAMLSSGKPDFPFCLCWANENWSRRWDGGFKHLLMEQNYSFEDDREHIQYLLPYFTDSRYIRINNKPVFIVFRTELFPDIKKTAELWRNEAIKSGIGDLYLIRVESFVENINPKDIGFDASLEFQPKWYVPDPPRYEGASWHRILHRLRIKQYYFLNNHVRTYTDFLNYQISNNKQPGYKRFPGITPGFDNTARRKTGAYLLIDSTPGEYGRWLKHICDTFVPFSKEENFIFINAWNEWAEGNHLEPCQKWGRSYLEMTSKILRENKDK